MEHLEIQHVTFAQHVFDGFIVGCPKLKTLILKEWDGFKNICIDAPNLKSLVIDGCFEDVSLQNTLNLASVHITLDFNVRWAGGSSANLLQFFVHLPNIRDLHLLYYSLKVLVYVVSYFDYIIIFYGRGDVYAYLLSLLSAAVFGCWSLARKAASTNTISE